MFWMMVCAVLATGGMALFFWAVFGWLLLPPRKDAVTVYILSGEEPRLEQQVRAFVWSQQSGLQAGRLILVGGCEPEPVTALAKALARRYACVEYCSSAQWNEIQESMEWKTNRR